MLSGGYFAADSGLGRALAGLVEPLILSRAVLGTAFPSGGAEIPGPFRSGVLKDTFTDLGISLWQTAGRISHELAKLIMMFPWSKGEYRQLVSATLSEYGTIPLAWYCRRVDVRSTTAVLTHICELLTE